jgi:hypothetical protein
LASVKRLLIEMLPVWQPETFMLQDTFTKREACIGDKVKWGRQGCENVHVAGNPVAQNGAQKAERHAASVSKEEARARFVKNKEPQQGASKRRTHSTLCQAD